AGRALRHPRLPRRGAGQGRHAAGRAREAAGRLDRSNPPGGDLRHGASLAGPGSLHFCGTRKPRSDSKPLRRFAHFSEAIMIRTGFIAAALALAACGGGTSTAATHFTASLNAANEPGSVTSGGTGTATYTVIGSTGYTNTGAVINYTISFSGLTAAANNGHIHV